MCVKPPGCMPVCTRRAMWRACVQLALVPAALSCRSWCGKWACPFDFCNDCFDRCAYEGLQSGTPKAHPLSNFVDSGEHRQPPDVKKSGARLPRFESPDWSLERDGEADRTAVDVTFELSLPKEDAHRFTPYFLGTNVPLYSPYHEMKRFHAPALVAAGIRVWRWPGGAASNFWCPSFEDEAWDACFDEFPIFKAPDLPQGLPAYPTNKELLHLSNFIDLCKESDCIPLFTINSGIALRYGIEKCVQYVAKVVRAFDKAGVPLKHFEFGNEMFGWWAAPYGYDDPSDGARDFMWDPADYGKAFTSVRTRLLEIFPNHPMSFGLVVNDDQEARCQGSHICYWNERILDDSNAGKDADWLSFHRYFSDYNKEWVHDHRILWSAGPLLDAVSRTVSGYWTRRHLPTKPIAITEYNSAFRQTPACGASQQFISLLWQTKFFGQTILRNEFQMLNHFSARAVPVKCTGKSDFAAYQVDGVKARAPTNSYSIVTPSFAHKNIPATPTPAYYAFWLWNRYMGEEVIQSKLDKGLAVFVSRFQDFPGEVGLILVNMDPGGRRVSIPGSSLGLSAGDSASLNAHVIQAGGDGGYPEADAWQKQNRLFDLTVLVNGEPMDTTNTYGGGPSMIDHIQPHWDYFDLKGTGTIDFDLPKQAVMGVLLSRTRFPSVVPPSSPPSPEPSPPPPAPPHEERLKISPLGVWMSSHVNRTEWNAKADHYKWADQCCAAGSLRSKCCPSSIYPSAERCTDGIIGNSHGWNFCLNSFTDSAPYPWLSVQVPRDSKIGDVLLAPREDCCEEELYPFEIWIGDVLGAGGDPYATNATRCGPRYLKKTLQVSCGGLQGSYVTLRLPGAGRTLMLSEITIYHLVGPLMSPAISPRESTPPRPPAPPPPPTPPPPKPPKPPPPGPPRTSNKPLMSPAISPRESTPPRPPAPPPPPTPPPPKPPKPPPPGPPRTSNKLPRLRASMSSTLTYNGTEYHAANCIDGKKTGQNFCMSEILPKQNHPNPAWLSIEVPENSKIGDVLIFNRMDCCQRFLSPFEVWVSNAPGVPGQETNEARRCGGTNVVPAEVGPFSVSCQGLVGSQVTILLPGDERVIVLAEVEIYSASNEPTRLPVQDSTDDSSPNVVPRSPNVVSNSQGTEGTNTMAYIAVAVGLLLGAALGIVWRNRCWCFPRQHIRVVADEAKEGRSKKDYDRKVASCSEIALESAESRRQAGE